MKILHIGIGSHFTEDMTYQDNMLTAQNIADGHEVMFLSDSNVYDITVKPVESGRKVTENGMQLVRLPYVHIINDTISSKIRWVKGMRQILTEFRPDIIFCHNLACFSTLDIIHYVKKHSGVKFYADTHAAYYNSATTWLSLHVLHRMFYRPLVQKTLPYLQKYFYIGLGEKRFSQEVYGVPESLMEFYPLGGTLFSDEAYAEKRARRRAELSLAPDELLLVHTGKLGPLKRTAELLQAFSAVPELRAKLAVIGAIPAEMEDSLKPLLEGDGRGVYLGWKSAEELMEYLCAADLYCQPGGVSATMQNAICCGCPVLSFPHESYVGALDCGEFFWIRTQEDIQGVFSKLVAEPKVLGSMTEGAWRCAREILDYRKLAARLYQ